LIDKALARQDAQPVRRIDWDRMNRVLPRQKAELTRAIKTQDAEKVAAVIKRHIEVWNEIGAWPDQWATWQIALDDLLPLGRQVDIRYL